MSMIETSKTLNLMPPEHQIHVAL